MAVDPAKYLRIFRQESGEHLEALSSGLLKLEDASGNAELVHELMRSAHTLKGAARMMNFPDICDVAHNMEDILVGVERGQVAMSAPLIDLLLEGTDTIKGLIEHMDQPGAVPPPDHGAVVARLVEALESGGKISRSSSGAPPTGTEPAVPGGSSGGSGAAPGPDGAAAGSVPKEPEELQAPSAPATPGPSPAPAAAAPSPPQKPASQDKSAKLEKYLRIFRQESAEHLEALSGGLLKLEQDSSDAELVHTLMRSAHTLKGAARMMNFPDICDVAHKMEDILVAVEKGQVVMSAELIDLLLEGTDTIKALVDHMDRPGSGPPPEHAVVVGRLGQAFESGGKNVPRRERSAKPAAAPTASPEPPSAAPAPVTAAAGAPQGPPRGETTPQQIGAPVSPPAGPRPEPPAAEGIAPPKKTNSSADETIRVEIAKIDALLDMIGELLISKIKMEDKIARSKGLHEYCDGVSSGGGRPLKDRLSKFTEELTADMVEMSYLTQEIQTRAMKIRMLPADTIFESFHRTVRDLSRELGKEAALKISGGKTELDKRVLEEIKPSLIHIIRNSLDHGLEMPEVREKLGKPRKGTIHLSAGHKGDTVTITIEDDGGGIDPQRVRRKALERGLIDEKKAESMDDAETLYLIMAPGFSTAEIITDISGRGVGMDVVKTNVQKLKGDVSIESVVGSYTRFSITLPLTLSTMNVLLFECGGETYALPLNYLEETCIVSVNDLITEGGRSVISLRGRTVAISRLDALLGLEAISGAPAAEMPALLVKSRGHVHGFIVDRFIGNQEIVVKSLGDHLRHVDNVAGATILGSGDPALILNAASLVSVASGERDLGFGVQRHGEERPFRILVVDDSITTRTMEKNVLETAGYDVEVAVDGNDALDKLAVSDYNLVVSDIEMPIMGGFDLISRIRQSERLRKIPVIIVSALANDEDKKRGIAVGANAYITKGSFDQENLLSTVRRLVR